MDAYGSTLSGYYDFGLVTASILIAVFAAYAALDLAGRVTAAKGLLRLAWLGGGEFTHGNARHQSSLGRDYQESNLDPLGEISTWATKEIRREREGRIMSRRTCCIADRTAHGFVGDIQKSKRYLFWTQLLGCLVVELCCDFLELSSHDVHVQWFIRVGPEDRWK